MRWEEGTLLLPTEQEIQGSKQSFLHAQTWMGSLLQSLNESSLFTLHWCPLKSTVDLKNALRLVRLSNGVPLVTWHLPAHYSTAHTTSFQKKMKRLQKLIKYKQGISSSHAFLFSICCLLLRERGRAPRVQGICKAVKVAKRQPRNAGSA